MTFLKTKERRDTFLLPNFHQLSDTFPFPRDQKKSLWNLVTRKTDDDDGGGNDGGCCYFSSGKDHGVVVQTYQEVTFSLPRITFGSLVVNSVTICYKNVCIWEKKKKRGERRKVDHRGKIRDERE